MLQALRLRILILIIILIAGAGYWAVYKKGQDKGFADGYARGTVSGPLKSTEDIGVPDSQEFTKEVFATKINATRQAIGLAALPNDDALRDLAQKDIDKNCGKIKSPGFKLEADPARFAGYNFYGEIISEETPTPSAVLTEWTTNNNHQPILLRPDFNAMGIGIKDKCVAVIFGNK